jgi:hypothetical protein
MPLQPSLIFSSNFQAYPSKAHLKAPCFTFKRQTRLETLACKKQSGMFAQNIDNEDKVLQH